MGYENAMLGLTRAFGVRSGTVRIADRRQLYKFQTQGECMNWKRFLVVMFALLAVLSLGSTRVAAQTTVSQGSIQGTITDPTGAVVPNAKVTFTNKATGDTTSVTSNASGFY